MTMIQIRFDQRLNCYCVHIPSAADGFEASYALAIIHQGWDRKPEDRYRFHRIRWIDGDWQELLTPEECAKRIADIADHEGEEVARLWEQHQRRYDVTIGREETLFEAAKRRFLAHVELGLDIELIHGEALRNPSHEMDEEAMAAISAARDKAFLDSLDYEGEPQRGEG